MKYLLLVCSLISINTLALNIDIQSAIADTKYSPYKIPNDPKIFQFIEYTEPPTKAQYITFYTLQVLDVITTYEGLKSSPNVREQNIFFRNNQRPSLGELVAFKIIMSPFIGNNLDRKSMQYTNVLLTAVVIYNYEIYN